MTNRLNAVHAKTVADIFPQLTAVAPPAKLALGRRYNDTPYRKIKANTDSARELQDSLDEQELILETALRRVRDQRRMLASALGEW